MLRWPRRRRRRTRRRVNGDGRTVRVGRCGSRKVKSRVHGNTTLHFSNKITASCNLLTGALTVVALLHQMEAYHPADDEKSCTKAAATGTAHKQRKEAADKRLHEKRRTTLKKNCWKCWEAHGLAIACTCNKASILAYIKPRGGGISK